MSSLSTLWYWVISACDNFVESMLPCLDPWGQCFTKQLTSTWIQYKSRVIQMMVTQNPARNHNFTVILIQYSDTEYFQIDWTVWSCFKKKKAKNGQILEMLQWHNSIRISEWYYVCRLKLKCRIEIFYPASSILMLFLDLNDTI